MNPEEFKKYLADLKNITYQQKAISQKSGIDNQKKDVTSMSELLANVENQLSNNKLNVLVMGRFNSGKSTFLNALMGRALLPAKAKPTTAVIGEISYAETPGATLYPKKTGEKPKEISIEELEKYVVIETLENEKDAPRKESFYSKLEIRYPLSICEKGINLVDSPGLDDPTCHDEVTKEYLPKADTIIYCMNSQQAFTGTDKVIIESLNSTGYKSIIFVLTYFDNIEYNDAIAGKNDAADVKRTYTRLLSKYTDLGEDGIFFVGSLPALTGKQQNNPTLIENSHFLPFEKRLEQVLFNQKGRLKLLKAYSTVKRANIDTRRFIGDAIDLTVADKTQLAEKLRDAREKLSIAEKRVALITQNFDAGAKSVVDDSEDKARVFLNIDVIPNIKQWVMETEPQTSISMLHPKESAKQFAEECLDQLKMKLETVTSDWLANEFSPNFLRPRIEALANEQKVNITSIDDDIKGVRTDLSLSPVDVDETSPSTVGRVGAAVVGYIGGGLVGGAVGALVGPQSIIPNLIAQLTSILVLTIVSFFTPVGFPLYVIGGIVAAISGGIWGLNNLAGKAKEQIAEQSRDGIYKNVEEIVKGISSKVQEIVDTISNVIKESINEPISEYQALVDEAKKNVESDDVTLQKRVDELKSLRESNNKLEEDLNLFSHMLMA
ncbi:MAG: dynamin family protein [Bacteroidaceae bacterium]|nr:dynamin family protein [Bacteroidaceae bacterium]